MPRIVTIDGPAGSGKTTLGRRLATLLGLPLVDTGLFYRGVTVAAARAGIDPDDVDALVICARRTSVVIDTDPAREDGPGEALVDGVDAGPELRDPTNAGLLARVSSLPGVRAALLAAQRAPATAGAVAVGRDCGTVVFPEAVVKLYLQASEGVRASRRAFQLRGAGARVDSASMHAEVRARDEVDRSRSDAPMRPAPDAHTIDTESLGIEEMVAHAVALCAGAGVTPA